VAEMGVQIEKKKYRAVSDLEFKKLYAKGQ